MFINLLFITVFGLFWGGLIFTAYKMGLADGREFAQRKYTEAEEIRFAEKHNGEKDGAEVPLKGRADGRAGAANKVLKEPLESEGLKRQSGNGEAREDPSRLTAILSNIDCYNGTSLGQKDI